MGHVGGEFTAQLLPLLPLRDVHGQHHGASHLAGLQHGACYDGERPLPLLHELLTPLAGQSLLRRMAKLRHLAFGDIIRLGGQKHGSAVVLREHMAAQVYEQKSLAHVLRHGGKLQHTAAQLVHLPADGVLLLPQPSGEGLQLGIYVLGIIGGNGVDGLCDLLRQTHGQTRCQQEKPRHRGRNGPGHIQQHGAQTALLPTQAQHIAVAEPEGIVEILFQHRIGVVAAFAAALLQRLRHLLAVQVVFHAGGLGHAVKKHGAVGGDEGDAVGGAHLLGSDVVQRLLQLLRLLRKRGKGLLFIVAVQDPRKEAGSGHEHQQRQAEQAAYDLPCHACPPSL